MIIEALGSLSLPDLPLGVRAVRGVGFGLLDVRIRGAKDVIGPRSTTLVLVVAPAKFSTVRQQDSPCPYGAAEAAVRRHARSESNNEII